MSFNFPRIDFVVLLVGADELDENNPIRVVDGRNKSIFVTANIEN
jgi:hypothetical protein